MKYQKVRNGIIIITGNVDTEAIEITAATTDYNNKTQDNKSVNKWEWKGERLQDHSPTWIILFHIPAKFGESFFRQFDLAMQLQKEELKKQGKVEAEVTEVMEEDIINAFESH